MLLCKPFIAMYRKEKCRSLFEDPDPQADKDEKNNPDQPRLMWHKDGSRDRRGSHSRVLVAIWTMELASKFGCNSEEFGLLISLEKMRSLDPEDAKETLEEVASRFTCAMFENPQAVLSGARHMVYTSSWGHICAPGSPCHFSMLGMSMLLNEMVGQGCTYCRYVAMSAHISVSLSIGSPCQFSLLGMSMLLNDMVGQGCTY
ncbi:global transcription factor group B1 [Tanacetum coccineum]